MSERAGPVGVVVMAHGTPARLEDLEAFYTEIRRGRPPSPAQLTELRQRYLAIGGTSPLNEITRAQAAGVAGALESAHPGAFVVEAGARFAAPRIEEAVDALVDRGVTRVVGVVLTPHSSRASVAEYARRAEAAVEAAGTRVGRSLPFVMIDHWWDAPGFDVMVAELVRSALARLPGATVVFTAHSVPAALVAAGDDYPVQVRSSADAVAAAAGVDRFTVAWQSAGRTDDEWLGPDLRDVITALADDGAPGVVVCPIGFVADHLEVLYDVDVEARAVAERVGVAFARTASLNASPALCALLADVVAAAAVPV